MHHHKKCLIALMTFFIATSALADTVTIDMQSISENKKNQNIGTITAQDSRYGLIITPNLNSLPPGIHGSHIHQVPSCDHNAMAAAGHFDPNNTNQHLGPYNDNGHLGDLPALTINNAGEGTLPVLAPRLKASDLKDHAVIIHAGGDNYSDTPTLGGGGSRIACGIVVK